MYVYAVLLLLQLHTYIQPATANQCQPPRQACSSRHRHVLNEAYTYTNLPTLTIAYGHQLNWETWAPMQECTKQLALALLACLQHAYYTWPFTKIFKISFKKLQCNVSDKVNKAENDYYWQPYNLLTKLNLFNNFYSFLMFRRSYVL